MATQIKNNIEVKEGGQANLSHSYIDASTIGVDGDVVGYIYELEDESGYLVEVLVSEDYQWFSNVVDLPTAQKIATDKVYEFATED